MIHVMIDLETMGTKVGSAVTAIGAYAFDEASDYSATFHGRASLASNQRAGLKLDADTLRWWLSQSDEARKEVTAPDDRKHYLCDMLRDFTAYLGRLRGADAPFGVPVLLWGNSAAFDLGLLGAAYDALAIKRPWSHREEACYRTLKNLRPDVAFPPFEGTPHNALDDARAQAAHLRLLLVATAAPAPTSAKVAV